jgi:hypothetical protein
MTDMQDGAEILKTDALARVRAPLERREQLLDEFERSGLSGVKFAALAGVKHATFAGWAAKRRRARTSDSPAAADPAAKVRWLEAVVQEAGGGLIIELAGGARARLSHGHQAPLLRALEKPLPSC